MATEELHYLTYADAALIHILTMWLDRETRFGAFDPNLVKSALARPQHAAVYENADLIRQAATLCFGLLKSHPWVGGNKRTATAITNEFLKRNGRKIRASVEELVEMVFAVESGLWAADEIELWLRARTVALW